MIAPATRLILAIASGLLALIAVMTAIDPSLDLAASGLFYASGTGFWLFRHPSVDWLREISMIPTFVLGGAAVVAVGLKLAFPSSRPILPMRLAVFFAATAIAAPVLTVNVILKEHWDRGRPVHVSAFGGQGVFTPWWQPGDGSACTRNCSFISGEASGAAWLVAPALLAPGPAQPVAVAAALVYTAVIATLRVAYGGHFLSDVALGALVTILIVVLAFRWLYAPGRPDDATLAARLGAMGDTAVGVVLGVGRATARLAAGFVRALSGRS